MAFYLTELAGLSPTQMGVVLAVGLAASAVIDVLIGARLGRLMPNACAAGRLQLIGAILCALAFCTVFAGFWAPVEFRFAYAMAASLAFRFAYAVYDVPQNALMTLATPDAASRNRIAATRIWFSGLATLIVAAAVAPMLAARDDGDLPFYLYLAVGMSVPAVAAAAILDRILRRAKTRTNRQPAPEHPGRLRPSAVFWLMMALMAVTSLATPLFAKVEPFFAAYVLKSPALGGVIAASMAIGIIAGQPFWPAMTRRILLPGALAVAAAIQLTGLAMMVLPDVSVAVLVLAAFLFGIGNGGVGMALWAGFSDVTAREAPGREGFVFGLFSGLAKLCLALGAFGLGHVLGGLDYRGDDSCILVWLMAGAPAVGAATCLLIAWAWRCREYPTPSSSRFARTQLD